MKQYFVYILASGADGTLYTGVSSNLVKRIYEHKNNMADGFTRKYGVHRLVYYENAIDIKSDISREKQIKRWKREWKVKLIEKENPGWKDLYYGIE